MPTNYTITLYTYDELSPEAQERARDWYRETYPPEDGWWESVYAWAKEAGTLMGIQVDDIWFSGFWSQGDGACFTGDYKYRANADRKMLERYPEEPVLHDLALRLHLLQAHHSNGLCAKVAHSDARYCHEHSVQIDVARRRDGERPVRLDRPVAEELRMLLRTFMSWIYKKLEEEYEYLVSDESVAEQLQADGKEFHEDGSPYRGPARIIAAGSHTVSHTG